MDYFKMSEETIDLLYVGIIFGLPLVVVILLLIEDMLSGHREERKRLEERREPKGYCDMCSHKLRGNEGPL